MKTRSTNQVLKSSTRHKLARSSEVNRAAGASNQPRVAGSRFLAAAPYHRVPRCGTVTGGNPRGCTGAWADPARRADEAIRIWMGPWRWFCSLHRGDACGGPNRRCNRAHIGHGAARHIAVRSRLCRAAGSAAETTNSRRKRDRAADARGRPNVIANWRGFAVSSSWRPWCWAATPCTTALR